MLISTRKCLSCGGELEKLDNEFYKCIFCKNEYEDKEENFSFELQHCVSFRQLKDFGKAEEICLDLIANQPHLAEAYWQKLLSELSIVYVADEDTDENGKIVKTSKPTFFLSDYKRESSIFDSDLYKKAIKFAASNTDRNRYISEAKKIDKLLEVYDSIKEDFDIFISYKSNILAFDEDGNRIDPQPTKDSIKAKEIYNYFSSKGYKVFYSPVSIGGDEDIQGEKYEPKIWKAIATSKAMILLGSKKKYLEAKWIKNEWSRYLYLKDIGKKAKNSLIIGYETAMPSLPKLLLEIQMPNFSWYNANYLKELEEKVVAVVGKPEIEKEEPLVEKEYEISPQSEPDEVEPLETNSYEESQVEISNDLEIPQTETISYDVFEKPQVEVAKIEKLPEPEIETPKTDKKEVTKVPNFKYKLSNDLTYYLLSGIGNCNEKEIVIPSKYKGLPVKKISANAFYRCKNLASIKIPSSITYIGNSAFRECTSLEKIHIPNSVTGLDEYVFRDCINLSSITFGDNSTLNNIGWGAFYGCRNLTSIKIPESVQCIDKFAFKDCINLEYIKISSGVKTINNNAFFGCKKLTNVIIPNGVQSIGDYAFSNCSKLLNIEISNTVQSIGSSAFLNCSSLTSVVIPNSVQNIGKDMFSGCSALEKITLPFVGYNIENKLVDPYLYPLGYIFGKTSYKGGVETEQMYYGSGSSSALLVTYYIPRSLKEIVVTGGDVLLGAFCNCSNIEKIVFEKGIASIRNYTFYNCSGLKSIEIPSSVLVVGKSVFHNCVNLKDVFYIGTKRMWKKVYIAEDNDCLKDAKIHFNK